MQAELPMEGTHPNQPAYIAELSEMLLQLCMCCMLVAELEVLLVNTGFALHTSVPSLDMFACLQCKGS